MDIPNLISVLAIAEHAIKAHEAGLRRKEAQIQLSRAYNAWKSKHGIEHVDRDTLDWTRMMVATKTPYDALEKAKRAERYARERLSIAVTRHKEGGAA
jgi:hypothetical protein